MKYSNSHIKFLFVTIMLLSCKKDKVPLPVPEPEPTKWEMIAGHYKVYDTLGGFIYEMDLVHVPAIDNDYVDSLRFENFDGNFGFTVYQSAPANYPMSISIGYHDTLYDAQQKRWKISSYLSDDNNQYIGDTVKLHFQKTNINYYWEDLTPYYSCDCKQIAVKQ